MCTHNFFQIKNTMSHLVQSLFDFFFCQPRVFLLVMLTTEIIFLAQNFPVNLPHWYKLPVLLPRPIITSESVIPSNHLILCRPLLLPPSIQAAGELILSRKLTWWGVCLKASTFEKRKFLFCFTKHCFLLVVGLLKLWIIF